MNESHEMPKNSEEMDIINEGQLMEEELLQACDGRHTDVSSAEILLRRATHFCHSHESAKESLEVADMIEKIGEAMDHLKTAMKQVH